MVKTVLSIFISALMLFCISVYERFRVNYVFEAFRERLVALYEKTEEKKATFTDGESVRVFWTAKRKELHVWVTHTSIENVDYQLNEAIGYLFEGKHDDALPKIEVLIEMTKKIPASYSFRFENVF
ncbi:MAG: DUF4363 family protein [Candidatus Borkfalkiaceae bacterium]|nr:DUF4363 family protein [Clostridia bacterium]MDY6222920.1 DUF4363 family protein [Christensenellaceae bacterium]